MTTTAASTMETLATIAQRDIPEVLLTDSKPAPNPTQFNPSVPAQASWTTIISGLPTAITPPSSTSSSTAPDIPDTESRRHGTSISLILLLSLSAAVMFWILFYVLISRRRRRSRDGKARPSIPRSRWPSFSLFALLRKGSSYRRIKRSDNSSSLLPSHRLAGAKLDHQNTFPPAHGHRVGEQKSVATWTQTSPVELDGQGIGDPPIRPAWMSRMSSFLGTGRGTPKGHCRINSSLKARRSIRESFGEKINDPGVAVLIQEPRKTFSRYSTRASISEKALPEIPESSTEETVPIVFSGPRSHWERTRASRNTFGSLKGGWASVRSLPLPDAMRGIEEEGWFTEVRTVGNR